MTMQTVPAVLKELWQVGFFAEARTIRAINDRLRQSGLNPMPDTLRMALSRGRYLTQRRLGKYRTYVQKYASEKVEVDKGILPTELAVALGKTFKAELEDLNLCFGRSGTCTAFLLRKILEKLIYITFAKHGLVDKLKDEKNNLVGLKTMLSHCETCKIQGKPFLMAKTAREIGGLKFLGDTSAHNPLINVDMETIIPMMPFIIIAYSELSRNL